MSIAIEGDGIADCVRVPETETRRQVKLWALGKRSQGQFSSVAQSCPPLLTPWTAAASLSITNCWSLLKPMSIESVMPSNHLILCRPLLLLPSIFPSIRVFSNESALHIRWPKYWSFSFNISPSKEHPCWCFNWIFFIPSSTADL